MRCLGKKKKNKDKKDVQRVDLPQKIHTTEIWPADDEHPFTGVTMEGNLLFRLESDCGWKIVKVLTDHTWGEEKHKCLVVVFAPDEREHDVV